VEPCDLLAVREEFALFYHVKVSTLSAHLSHLFNQGVNAIELLRLDPQAVNRLDALIWETLSAPDAAAVTELVRNRKYCVASASSLAKTRSGARATFRSSHASA
jgi:uncharacterized protein (TIGR04141 family)